MPDNSRANRPTSSPRKRATPSLVVGIMCGSLAGVAHAGNVCPCLGDLNGSGTVDGADLALVLGNWGACPLCAACASDITGNCMVDGADLAIVLGQWGPCSQAVPNDLCANPTIITNFTGSANPFCTIGASSSGPAIIACGAPAINEISNDVWFRVIAPLSGTLQFGACADFNVRMAIYGEGVFGGCSCPGAPFGATLIGCSTTDSFPSCAQGTALLVEVEAGDCLTIRIGGAGGQVGTGNLDINFYLPPCSLASTTKLAASGLEAEAEHGIGIDISGDRAVVGAIFDDLFPGGANAGSARIYEFNGVSWVLKATVISPDSFSGHRFGINVAASGDRIIVGAGTISANCDADPNCDTGIAYIFEFDGSSWIHDASLVPDVSSAKSHFGNRVDIDGGRAIVAASNDVNANGDRAGAAHVYEYVSLFGGFWFESAKLMASDGDNFDEFGSDVAISGAWAIVGADNDEAGGSAYLFQDTGASWTQVAKLKPAGLPGTADFGTCVAIDGDLAIIGAPDYGTGKGAAYVYENFGAAGWLMTAKLEAHEGDVGDAFGTAVSIATSPLGSTISAQVIVGAGFDEGGRGSAYVFWRVGGGWVERGRLTAADGVAGDAFGNGSVAISHGRGLVGAYLDDVGLSANVGSVLSFLGLGECTGNGVMDACDIANGLPDSDGDGVPDICEP